ncbi:MAG TPA: outer membrane beta-barrel protein [Gemmatimonadales bacterium]|nr:outer membrane beta-barrel protein [Gemmatimonadales bacterium]
MRSIALTRSSGQDRTRQFLVAAAVAGSLLVLAAGPAAAQRGTGVHVAPYAGYMITGNMFEGPFGTNIGSANGPIVGAQLGVDLTPSIAIVGNVGYTSSDLEIGVPILGGLGVGTSNMWLYDGALQLSVPLQVNGGMGIRPFVQGGAGAITQRVSASIAGTDATSFAWNVGGGVDLQFSRNVGLRLMAKDYIGRFDTREAVGFDLDNEYTHNWGITVGLKLGF